MVGDVEDGIHSNFQEFNVKRLETPTSSFLLVNYSDRAGLEKSGCRETNSSARQCRGPIHEGPLLRRLHSYLVQRGQLRVRAASIRFLQLD